MTNQVVTLRPNTTIQLGSFTVVGAATAHQALSDNSDASYVQLVPRCRIDPDVLKVGVPAPSIPATSKIFSVTTRVRVQTITGFFTPFPFILHWFKCRHSFLDELLELIYFIVRWIFSFFCPKQPTVTWTTVQLSSQTTNPAGTEWTVTIDFDQFECHFGRDDDYANPLRISEVYVDVTYNVPPTVTVTGPTGTNTANCRPPVTWVYADAEHDPQQAYRVQIFNSAQYSIGGFAPTSSPSLIDSGWVPGDVLTWPMPLDLVNDSYRAYVTVQQVWSGLGTSQSGGLDYSAWTQNIVGAPIVNFLSATFEPTLNRVKLVIQPSTAVYPTVTYNIETSQDGGGTWTRVRGGIQLPANGQSPVTLYDYEAPLNVVSLYRALGYRQVASLRFVSAAYSNIVSVTPTSTGFWLKDVLNPALNSPLPVAYLGDIVTQQRSQGVFAPIVASGATAFKVVVNGPRYGIEGTLRLIFTHNDPQDYWAAFNALDGSGRTLLLQYPTGEQHYITFGPGTTGSDMTYQWDGGAGKVRYRKAEVSYTEVAQPSIS